MAQMTQPTTPDLDLLLQRARERATHGSGSRRDWEQVAAIDAPRARQELREHLQRNSSVIGGTVNPYESRPRQIGAAAGFAIGVVLMIIVWLLMAWARNTIVTTGMQWNIATAIQYSAAALPPLCTLLAARHARSSQNQSPSERVSLREASFDELLDRFEQTQRIGRTRVY